MLTADDVIQALELEPHVEGGYFGRSFVSDSRFDDSRNLWTSIYFMLKTGEVSHLHQLTADEMWYFHSGESLTIYMISEQGELTEAQLGWTWPKVSGHRSWCPKALFLVRQ